MSTTEERFVGALEKFKRDGYKFNSTHELRKGRKRGEQGTQREAFDGYLEGLKDSHRHGYFEIPTGVGKTALFISLIKNYLDAVNGSPDAPRVLIAVPSTDLVVQTAKAFAKFMPEIAPKIEADDDTGHEIDWERSDVGVQYGKTKHAEKNQRYLSPRISPYARIRQIRFIRLLNTVLSSMMRGIMLLRLNSARQ